MSETPARYNDRAEWLAAECLALLDVFTLPEGERPEAAERLAGACWELPLFIPAVAAELKDRPDLSLVAALTILNRPALRDDLEKVNKAAGDPLNPAKDPKETRAAFARVLERDEANRAVRRLEDLRKTMARALEAPDIKTAGDFLAVAQEQADRAERGTVQTLADAWTEHRKTLGEAEATNREGIKLDPRRGPWAGWLNRWLGNRAALMPGKSVLFGAASGGGKTSLAAALAVDAMAAGCPVRFHQLELGRAACLEYLFHNANPDAWKDMPFKRTDRDLPNTWADLLDLPADASPKGPDAVADLQRMARAAARARKGNPARHACNGLFILDYAQLLAKAVAGDAFHEALAASVSALAKAAAESGACLLVLSQVNKSAQADGLTQTAFAGADLARMTDCAFTIEKANYEANRKRPFRELKKGKPARNGKDGEEAETAATFEPRYGHARLIRQHKGRGSRPEPGERLDDTAGLWICDAALHGTNPQDAAPARGRAAMPEIE